MTDGSRLLSRIGTISVSVSFAVASEINDAALEAGMRRDELVAVVLLTYVVLGMALFATKSAFKWISTKLEDGNESSVHPPKAAVNAALATLSAAKNPHAHTIFEFVGLITELAQHILLSLAVQLITDYVSTNETSRTARVITLVSVSVFFMFFQWSSELMGM